MKVCTTCGTTGDCGGTIAKCANCWEVEGRLDRYLCSEKGREFVASALAVYAPAGGRIVIHAPVVLASDAPAVKK
jgi:hypothetical protein